ncbi:hypothetical protein AVEN_231227-1 [Araneus ventricosus]|uniref:Uncharacterized protein n=1 Tax=Araneus ventricosus TaxID=182803 RepID=A0A4Y2TFX3_ARAVE|nr:hypothetical protein AVEN_231227-1 [Araneus ventricosus]
MTTVRIDRQACAQNDPHRNSAKSCTNSPPEQGKSRTTSIGTREVRPTVRYRNKGSLAHPTVRINKGSHDKQSASEQGKSKRTNSRIGTRELHEPYQTSARRDGQTVLHRRSKVK